MFGDIRSHKNQDRKNIALSEANGKFHLTDGVEWEFY